MPSLYHLHLSCRHGDRSAQDFGSCPRVSDVITGRSMSDTRELLGCAGQPDLRRLGQDTGTQELLGLVGPGEPATSATPCGMTHVEELLTAPRFS